VVEIKNVFSSLQEVHFATFFIRKELQFLKRHAMLRILDNGHNPEP
jgi:hypothetical protein